jgi:thiosulfate dehydrogenase [quinone] large subunit
MIPDRLSGFQAAALVVLRTLVGWHFLYEGYYKAMAPAWSRAGHPFGPFSSRGYLRAATGPLADVFHKLAEASWLDKVDVLVVIGLVLVGLSLLLGLFTQAGCLGALGLLAMFYLSAIPTSGALQPGGEGTYLFVNKNLIEAAAVLALLAFRTGRIAGLDLLLTRSRAAKPTEALAS